LSRNSTLASYLFLDDFISWLQAEQKLFAAVADLDLVQVKELLSQHVSANTNWLQVINWTFCNLRLF